MSETNGGDTPTTTQPCDRCGVLLGPDALFRLDVEAPEVHSAARCEEFRYRRDNGLSLDSVGVVTG